jgi:hypothetical protein
MEISLTHNKLVAFWIDWWVTKFLRFYAARSGGGLAQAGFNQSP